MIKGYSVTYAKVRDFPILYWERVRSLRNDTVTHTLFKRGAETITKSGVMGREDDKPLLLIVNKAYREQDRCIICDLNGNPMFMGSDAIVLPWYYAQKTAIMFYKQGVVR